MRVLSLFDGISGARQALKELNIDCEYYASEIDKYAMQISKANYPDIVQMGDVRNVGGSVIDVDLLIGGSPCQDLSIAGNGKGLEGKRSGLFFEYLRILNKVKPRYFVLENVASMKAADRDIISKNLGIEPIMINSALLTAQQRKRYYWVGKLVADKYNQVIIEQPKEANQLLMIDENWCYAAIGFSNKRFFRKTEKLGTLTASMYKGVRGAGRPIIAHKSVVGQDMDSTDKSLYRMLTVNESCELQGFPSGYCDSVSKTQAYKALGNSFTVPVIKHILSTIFKN